MRNQSYYKNIKEFVQALNVSEIPYLVIRNFENLYEKELYVDGHGDIDLLCADSKALAKKVNAIPKEYHLKNGKEDGTHYYIYIDGKYCNLDLRSVGDGYYCQEWEKDLLKNRVLNNGFYVPAPKDYFYSLIYHSIFQKKEFSEDYRRRLKKMGQDLQINIEENKLGFYIRHLEMYMRENGYTYVYPNDKYVPFRKGLIQDKSLLVVDRSIQRKHCYFHSKLAFIGFLVGIKHRLFGKK
ncbi:MAG: hypothetical protein PHC38_09080 [Weeksellaceae bacterium]|nr:hypothetical protein [Weeksellaceae bacterium]